MTKLQTPKTIQEVGIHLAYMADQLDKMSNKLNELTTNFAEKEEVAKLEIRVEKLEGKNGFKQTLLWVGLVASAIINIIALYNIFTGE